MWPLVLALVVATTGAYGAEMVCPGLETMYWPPQCINDRDKCPQNSTLEPASKVCNMCDGCTAYIREYELIIFKTTLQPKNVFFWALFLPLPISHTLNSSSHCDMAWHTAEAGNEGRHEYLPST